MDDKRNPIGLFLAALWMVSGIFLYVSCAPIPGRSVDLSDCADGDKPCIIRAIMSVEESPDDMFQFMEGYVAVDLHLMSAIGRLTINEINPLIPILSTLTIGPVAYTSMARGAHGGMYSADIYYPSWFPGANGLLAHELKHARGLKDVVLFGPDVGYTKAQEAIMSAENVSKWTDTSYYRSEDPTYHWGTK